jgi:DNA repair exonuclease SbcCD ATPase subunit
LREIEENIGRIEREMANVERERHRDDPRAAMMERMRQLREEAPHIRRELAQMEDKDSDQARELRAHLENVHEAMAETERQLQQFGRERAGRDRPGRDMPEERRRDLMRRLDQLTAEAEEAEAMLHRHEQRGEGASDAANELRERLEMGHQEMREIEGLLRGEPGEPRAVEEERRIIIRRLRGDRDIPENERLRMEMEELRGQVHGLHEQMEEMRALLERVIREPRPPGERR